MLLEAIACETPVVSVDCPAGPKEILKKMSSLNNIDIPVKEVEYSDYGVLIPPFNLNADFDESLELTDGEILFANSVIKLLKNEELYNKYKNICRERIKDFSTEVINSQWINLIDSL